MFAGAFFTFEEDVFVGGHLAAGEMGVEDDELDGEEEDDDVEGEGEGEDCEEGDEVAGVDSVKLEVRWMGLLYSLNS